MKELLKKLHAAKGEIGKISKDSTNPFFHSKFFDINKLLDVVEPILHKHGLLCLQPIKDGHVVTELYDVESGEMKESSMKLSEIQDPQKRGSEITYFRRYTLQSLLSLQAEDDDGNAASQTKAETKPTDDKPWLNLKDKEGQPTKTYNDMKARIEKGEVITLETLKGHFKIAVATKDILANEFNIK